MVVSTSHPRCTRLHSPSILFSVFPATCKPDRQILQTCISRESEHERMGGRIAQSEAKRMERSRADRNVGWLDRAFLMHICQGSKSLACPHNIVTTSPRTKFAEKRFNRTMPSSEAIVLALAESLADAACRLKLVARARSSKTAMEVFTIEGDAPTSAEVVKKTIFELLKASIKTCPDVVPTSSDPGHALQMLDRRFNHAFSKGKGREASRFWAMGGAYIYGVIWSNVRLWWRKSPLSSKPGLTGDKIQELKDLLKKLR